MLKCQTTSNSGKNRPKPKSDEERKLPSVYGEEEAMVHSRHAWIATRRGDAAARVRRRPRRHQPGRAAGDQEARLPSIIVRRIQAGQRGDHHGDHHGEITCSTWRVRGNHRQQHPARQEPTAVEPRGRRDTAAFGDAAGGHGRRHGQGVQLQPHQHQPPQHHARRSRRGPRPCTRIRVPVERQPAPYQRVHVLHPCGAWPRGKAQTLHAM